MDQDEPLETATFSTSEETACILRGYFAMQLESQDVTPRERQHLRSVSGLLCSYPQCAKCHPAEYVLYQPWKTWLSVCRVRVEEWNKKGRFRDSRQWVQCYVMLLMNMSWLEALRGVFRLYARSLMWPRYRIAKTSAEERLEKEAGTYDGPFHK